MAVKNKIKKFVERLTGTHIYRVLPRGISFADDITNKLPTYKPNIIFDVGANVGQSANHFIINFPNTHIYCFEPVGETYALLQQNMQDIECVDCYQLALGSSKEMGKMVLQGSSDMFFLLGQSLESPNDDANTELVDIDTLDNFCQTNRIDHISYLKTDTEGGDLEVLRGADTMLAEQQIDFIQVEAGMNPTNSRHVPFESIKSFLERHQYYLFGIYEQVSERPTKGPHLRRTNPIFISQQLVKQNRRAA